MSIHPSKQRDAKAAVIRQINSKSTKGVDEFLVGTAQTLDKKTLKFMGLATGVASPVLPSTFQIASVSLDLALTAGFISGTVIAVSQFAEYYNSPARHEVYIPSKRHSIMEYMNSFDKAERMRTAYETAEKGAEAHKFGHKLADAMARKMFWLRKGTNLDIARLSMESYPKAEPSKAAEKERLKRMDKKMDTYLFHRYTDPTALEQSIDAKLARREQQSRNVPSDFDYNLVQLFAMAADDNTAISRVIQESSLVQWLQPLFDNHKQVLGAFKHSLAGNEKENDKAMIKFVRDMHYALGDLTPLVLGEDLSNYKQIKDYEKLTTKCLSEALDTVQTNVLQQSLCEDISQFAIDVFKDGKTVPLANLGPLVTRLTNAVEGRRLHAQSPTNPYPKSVDAKLGDIPHIANLLGQIYADASQQGKTGVSNSDIATIPQLNNYLATVINTTPTPDPETRTKDVAATLHQLALGSPIAEFDKKALHAQWFENLFKEIHTRALTGIQAMPTGSLKAEYLDELLQEYPDRLKNLASHRRRANFAKAIIAEPISTVNYSVQALSKGGILELIKKLKPKQPAVPGINVSAQESNAAMQALDEKLNAQTPPTPAPTQPAVNQQLAPTQSR